MPRGVNVGNKYREDSSRRLRTLQVVLVLEHHGGSIGILSL